MTDAEQLHQVREATDHRPVEFLKHLANRAKELVPDHPFQEEGKPWPHGNDAFDYLWALTSSLEGARLANEYCHKEISRLKDLLDQMKEWKTSVLSAVQQIPEYATGEWAGDKEGWGFVFELINWQTKELAKHRTTSNDENDLCDCGHPHLA